LTVGLRAASIEIPNGSFESPETPFADPGLDSWEKTPKPFWYDESGGGLWIQLTGVFLNTPEGSDDHIENADGTQAAFMFAVPEVGIFQDYESIGGTNSTPAHDFDATFEVGKSYTLTVGIIGGGLGMLEGVTMEMGFYYRDDEGNRVTVASNSITHSAAVFTTNTHLVDFETHVPVVQADDLWAGRHLGVHFLSTVQPELAGGHWNLDNVRLVEDGEPMLLTPMLVDGQFRVTVQSEPDRQFEILAAPEPTVPLEEWANLGTVTNLTGTVEFIDVDAASSRRYYRARQIP
jgi:hypothetical protein